MNIFQHRLASGFVASIAIIVCYISFTGFYSATTIAFFLLLTAYDPASYSNINSWVKRIIITACFIAIMYTLFAKILVVYTPRGMFI